MKLLGRLRELARERRRERARRMLHRALDMMDDEQILGLLPNALQERISIRVSQEAGTLIAGMLAEVRGVIRERCHPTIAEDVIKTMTERFETETETVEA